MLTKSQLEKYADVLIWGLTIARNKAFRAYDNILIRYDTQALPLLESLYQKLIESKFQVSIRSMLNARMEKDFFDYSDKRQRNYIAPGQEEFFRNLNGNIFLSAPDDLTHLRQVDPEKINQVALVKKKLRHIMEQREMSGKFSWTLCTYPTAALAQKAGLSIKQYSQQIVQACYLNEIDPVAKWQQIFHEAHQIKTWLNNLPIRHLRIQSQNIDLLINLGEKRKFIGISGHNIPSFEIFSSPDWRDTEGSYYANQPSYFNGNYVRGVRLHFAKGRAIKIAAEQGDAFVKKMLSMDAGACQIGEFSLTDKRFSRINRFMADTLFDENYGGKQGNCHIAVGSSYLDTYRGNASNLSKSMIKQLGFNDSALHWDLVNTEKKQVTAILKNGKKIVIYENGIFCC